MFSGFLPSATPGNPAFGNLRAPTASTGAANIVECVVGNLALQGFQANIGATSVVNAGVGNLALEGHAAEIVGSTDIWCNVGDLALQGHPASFPESVGGALTKIVVTYTGTDDMIPVFDLGDTIRVIATFTDETETLITPVSTPVINVRRPGGALSAPLVVNQSTGIYYADITTDIEGRWRLEWRIAGQRTPSEFIVQPTMMS